MMHHEERFGLVASVLQPVNSKVGHDIRGVTHFLYLVIRPFLVSYVTCKESRVEVFALSAMTVEYRIIVEVRRFASQMPFTDHGSLISHIMELINKIFLVRLKHFIQSEHLVTMGILSGHDTCTAWGTDGVCTETVLEEHTVPCQFINCRSRVQYCKTTSVCADSLRSMVVRHDVDDIHLFLLCCDTNTYRQEWHNSHSLHYIIF